MANNSINKRFRNLYQEVEDNLTDESKAILNELYKRGAKSLHEYRNNLLELLKSEYSKIIANLAIENNISVEEIEYRMLGTPWDCYGIAIEKLNEPIHKYKTEEEFNKEAEELMGDILNQTDEETAYWSELREAVYGFSDEDEEQAINEEFEENYPEEERVRDSYVFNIEKCLQDKLTTVVKDVEKNLGITGQVIDFMLQIYIDV